MDLQKKHNSGQASYSALPAYIYRQAQQKDAAKAEQELVLQQSKVEDASAQLRQLMEALGEMWPLPEDQLNLLHELDNLFSEILDGLDETSPLVSNVKASKTKLKQFLLNTKKRKEESLSLMEKQLRSRSYRYEDSKFSSDLVQQLFQSMRQVLKEDIEMRTGKGLLQSSSQSKTSDTPPKPTKNKPDKPREPTSPTWSSWFYGIFVDTPLGLFKSSKNPDDISEEEEDLNEEEDYYPDVYERRKDSSYYNTKDSSYYNTHWLSFPSVNNASTQRVQDFPEDVHSSEYIKHNILFMNSNVTDSTNLFQNNNEEIPAKRTVEQPSESWYVKPVTVPYRWIASYLKFSSIW